MELNRTNYTELNRPYIPYVNYLSSSNSSTANKLKAMPPLNESNANTYSEPQIPGMTLMNDTQSAASSVSLRTHSSKFPVKYIKSFFFAKPHELIVLKKCLLLKCVCRLNVS